MPPDALFKARSPFALELEGRDDRATPKARNNTNQPSPYRYLCKLPPSQVSMIPNFDTSIAKDNCCPSDDTSNDGVTWANVQASSTNNGRTSSQGRVGYINMIKLSMVEPLGKAKGNGCKGPQ
jgi:hypothetical protein